MSKNDYMNVVNDEIYNTIKKLGLPTDFKLDIKDYSKRYAGRYDPNKSKVITYYLDENKKVIDIDDLIKTIIHECIHHYQWKHDKGFTRLKGVMHNEMFKMLEKKYIGRYERMRKRGQINVIKIEKNLVKYNGFLN